MNEELDKVENVSYTEVDDSLKESHTEALDSADETNQQEGSTEESSLINEDNNVSEDSDTSSQDTDPYENDPYRALAEKYGWNPEKGDKSPKEFIEYPFDKKIKTQQRSIRDLEGRISQLTEMLVEQNRSKYTEDKQYLQQIVDTSDDPDQVRQAFKELEAIKTKEESLNKYQPAEATTQSIPVETMDFLHSHPDWFPNASNPNAQLSQKQVQIQQYAIQRENQLKQMHPGLDGSDMYDIIEAEIVNKFERTKPTTKINKPQAVKPTKSSGTAPAQYDKNTLSDFDKRMYVKLVDSGIVDKKTFFESLKQNRG